MTATALTASQQLTEAYTLIARAERAAAGPHPMAAFLQDMLTA